MVLSFRLALSASTSPRCVVIGPNMEVGLKQGCWALRWEHFDGLAQDCSNSNALAMELLQSCTKTSAYSFIYFTMLADIRQLCHQNRRHCHHEMDGLESALPMELHLSCTVTDPLMSSSLIVLAHPNWCQVVIY